MGDQFQVHIDQDLRCKNLYLRGFLLHPAGSTRTALVDETGRQWESISGSADIKGGYLHLVAKL